MYNAEKGSSYLSKCIRIQRYRIKPRTTDKATATKCCVLSSNEAICGRAAQNTVKEDKEVPCSKLDKKGYEENPTYFSLNLFRCIKIFVNKRIFLVKRDLS